LLRKLKIGSPIENVKNELEYKIGSRTPLARKLFLDGKVTVTIMRGDESSKRWSF